jgi:hypothetical protein
MRSDGDGFNITLQALPLDGKIVLRLTNSDAKNDAESDQQSIRDANVRRKTHGGIDRGFLNRAILHKLRCELRPTIFVRGGLH